ncbi:MAG: putative metal-dependent hydrolase [Bacteroidetes bacterium]|nr:putative metal-dependent hydrolase [Bacteroidota bacterium]
MKKSESLRYPVGKHEYGKNYTYDETRKHVKIIASLPDELKRMLKKMNSELLDKSYRKGGWTVRQVVHHLADSHINAYIRMKLAVTEPTPIIKPYEEALWAEREDAKYAPVKLSLKILNALTRRWVYFLESLSAEDLERGYFHPATQRVVLLQDAIAAYAWHSRHHLAHINLVLKGEVHEPGSLEHDANLTTDAFSDPRVLAKKRGPKPRLKETAAAGETVVTDAAPKKRGPKPRLKETAAAGETVNANAAPKKRGPKPRLKETAAAGETVGANAAPKKRGPKPRLKEAAGETVVTDATPKKRGPKPRLKEAAGETIGADAAPKKRGPKPRIKASANELNEAGKESSLGDNTTEHNKED